MKALSRVGGSLSMLYLVCILFAVGAAGFMPTVLIPHAHADTASDIAKVIDVAVAVKAAADGKAQPTVTVQAEPVGTVEAVMSDQPTWMQLSANLIALLSILAAVVPKASPHAGAVITVLRKLLDIGAFNVLFAKNEPKQNETSKGRVG